MVVCFAGCVFEDDGKARDVELELIGECLGGAEQGEWCVGSRFEEGADAAVDVILWLEKGPKLPHASSGDHGSDDTDDFIDGCRCCVMGNDVDGGGCGIVGKDTCTKDVIGVVVGVDNGFCGALFVGGKCLFDGCGSFDIAHRIDDNGTFWAGEHNGVGKSVAYGDIDPFDDLDHLLSELVAMCVEVLVASCL